MNFRKRYFPSLRSDFMLIEKTYSIMTAYLNFSPFGSLVHDILDFKEFLSIKYNLII
ncbi:hypothetical protein BCR32DRAFT_284936 [Anaeromyces robustus]|uniref:Uncharacterized protein n=1 Tax=Anaeromyces robustus TaxID=1754192 RepID=A0A1Y1WQY6_9FUNG|nr:hypothetical protein BCR32DRAFT_284936 [Anaeromyces robustus]|eukprot:ORX75686.1 hypothetical protein BCR32DRAFT_284936 [Anaeromyces robustus]